MLGFRGAIKNVFYKISLNCFGRKVLYPAFIGTRGKNNGIDQKYTNIEDNQELFNNDIKREKENLHFILQRFRKASMKLNKISEKPTIDVIDDYKFLIDNFMDLNEFQLNKFVISLVSLNIKDAHLLKILEKSLGNYSNINSCFCIFYSFSHLRYSDFANKNDLKDNYDSLLKEAMIIFSKIDLCNDIEKPLFSIIFPTISSIIDLELLNPENWEKIDNFVLKYIEVMSLRETSQILNWYSKMKNYNVSVLEKVIKKLIDNCRELELIEVVLVSKSLGHLKIKNLNLLSGLQQRLEFFLKNEAKIGTEEKDKVNVDYYVEILFSFLNLDYIDLNSYTQFEDIFFKKLEKSKKIKTKTITTILKAHQLYFRKNILQFVNKKEDDSQVEILLDKKAKLRRRFLNRSEEFFGQLLPYVLAFKEKFEFDEAFDVLLNCSISNIYKRNNLKILLEFTLYIINTHLSENPNSPIKNDKINNFIDMCFRIFKNNASKTLIQKALESNRINYKVDNGIEEELEQSQIDSAINELKI